MNNKPVLAIILPCYNEEEIIEKSVEQVTELMDKLVNDNSISQCSYISYVDDGSSDKTWKILKTLAENNKKLNPIRLAYNSGHQNALMCGMINNDADIYITLDCDLQDDINVIPEMINKCLNENVDIVYAVRSDRNCDSFCKKLFADTFYAILPFLKIKHLRNCADFRLVTANVICLLKQISENNLYLRGLLQEYNFKYTTVEYKRKKRIGGNEKYSFDKSFELAINAILNSSLVPIRLITIIGFAGIFLSIFIKSLLLLCTGFNLIALGIVGEYLGRIFIETKKRPPYIIKERINN